MSHYPPLDFLLGLSLACFCHEAGHVLCGWAVGLPIRACRVGIGRRLVRWRIGDMWLELRWLPLTGAVQPYPELWRRRSRHVFLVCGGALGNATAFAVIAALDAAGLLRSLAPDTPAGLGVAQLLLLVANLIPFSVRVEGHRSGSDGLQILRSLFRRVAGARDAVDPYLHVLRRYDATATPDAVRSRAAPRLAYWLLRPARWDGGEEWQDAQDGLQWLLARSWLSQGERLLALDLLATDVLVVGAGHVGPQVEAWSRQAFDLAPDLVPLRATRGSALAELGRHAEAKMLLQPLAECLADEADVFMSRLFLALAEQGLGNVDAAGRWLAAAREAASRVAVAPPFLDRLARAETQLGGGERGALQGRG